jgi:hypothetical protein
MPNWCSNKLSITANTAEHIAELKEWYAYVSADTYSTEEGKGFFHRVLPTPPNMADDVATHTQVALWGTKWEVHTFATTDYDNGSLVLEFDTAWSPPMGICMELARRGYLIRLEYFEPGMCFGGIIENNDNIAEPNITHSDDMTNFKDEVRQELEGTFFINDWYEEEEEEEEIKGVVLPSGLWLSVKKDDSDEINDWYIEGDSDDDDDDEDNHLINNGLV